MRDKDIIGFHRIDEPNAIFSNWYHAEFDLAGHHYTSSEQYMMYQKVMLADEYDLADKIMATDNPKKIKYYAGPNSFKTYDKIKNIWERDSRHIVKRGIRAKFAQNPKLLEKLLATGQALLCECAGNDTVWGIGIDLNNPSWHDVRNWKGKNYLGMDLMELRDEFRCEIAMWGSVQNADYMDAEPIDVWNMRAGDLKRNPVYYNGIHAYAARLPLHNRDIFYYDNSLNDWDIAMHMNMGGGLPIAGFYEMKQEIYEISKRAEGMKKLKV